MMPCILHLTGNWVDNLPETYCPVDSSQHTDFELVSLQRAV